LEQLFLDSVVAILLTKKTYVQYSWQTSHNRKDPIIKTVFYYDVDAETIDEKDKYK